MHSAEIVNCMEQIWSPGGYSHLQERLKKPPRAKIDRNKQSTVVGDSGCKSCTSISCKVTAECTLTG